MKLIIFDCDGTLVDSQHMITEALLTAFSEVGFPAPKRSTMLRQVGLSVNEAMVAMTGLDHDDEIIAALGQEFRKAFAALRNKETYSDPLFHGAREALTTLRLRDDVLLGIATGKSRRGVDLMLEREGFSGFFSTIQTADDAPSKPHPAMIEQARDETGIAPELTIMIGDTSFDMAMARAASVAAIGVSWGYHAPEELTEAGAAHIADDFAGLTEHLLKS